MFRKFAKLYCFLNWGVYKMDDNEQMYQRVRSALMSSYIDKLSTKNESYAKNLESPHANFVDRNERLTALFQLYISNKR